VSYLEFTPGVNKEKDFYKMKITKPNLLDQPRTATIALWGGITFSAIFVALIWWAGQRLDAVQLLPDQGAAWYY
jgi:hypothetical protein